ncbi:MAG TPA: hypothetical protein PK671_00730, partial [Candidatus Obscuribacter sp.]|nr:hypothetical protein [Candidatus Obscuribacter sp.]
MKKKQMMVLAVTLTLSVALSLPVVPAGAQGQTTPQVYVVNLQVVQNPDGSQSVVTPKGDLAPLPGGGVNGAVAQIYMGAQGGYWYTDRNGQTIDLAPAVQQLKARREGLQRASADQIPQYAPNPYSQQSQSQSQTQSQTQSQSSGSSGGSALGTGLAAAAGAGLGAMAGTAMTHGYYNAPYGTPMYYGANGNPYYWGGDNQPLQNLNENQQVALYNSRQVKNQQQAAMVQGRQETQQAAISQTGTNQAQRQAAYSANNAPAYSQGAAQEGMAARQANGGAGAHADLQKQQQWYQQQMSQNPQRFAGQNENPFVNRDGGSGGRFGGASADASERGAQGGGRFGGGEGGQGGGRFGGGEGG